jgi:EAL domain-containing protein (putative c-di-GMP-specific phosphodiesterase class I)
VAAVVGLAHTLGLIVVAEGVETVRQFAEVAALGCERCQGYYFARPMSADALDAVMTRRAAGANPTLPIVDKVA